MDELLDEAVAALKRCADELQRRSRPSRARSTDLADIELALTSLCKHARDTVEGRAAKRLGERVLADLRQERRAA